MLQRYIFTILYNTLFNIVSRVREYNLDFHKDYQIAMLITFGNQAEL